MNKKHLSLIFLLFIVLNVFSQNISVSMGIDTNIFKVSEPLNLWLEFLKTKDDSLGAKYWNNEEVAKYGKDSYFLIEKEFQFGSENYLKLISQADVKILRIKKMDEFFKITSTLEFLKGDNPNEIMYVFHVYAGYENNELRLFNPLQINSKYYFNKTTVGFIKYHYPKYHEFNLELAKTQNNFLIDFCSNFNAPIDTVDFYFAQTNEEILKLKGFDFLYGDNGLEIPSGRADHINKNVYCSGSNEYYPHEIIHIFINPYYPNCHSWFNEGLATFFGMSRGKTLDWHLGRLNAHLSNHPEINLNNLLDYNTMDVYTSYKYVLGGYIIKLAYEKGSYDLVKKLLKSGKGKDDFYNAIEKYLNIKQKNLNEIIRESLKTTYNKE